MTRTPDNAPPSEAGDGSLSPSSPPEEESSPSSNDLTSASQEGKASVEPDDAGDEDEADVPTKARVEDLFRKLSRTTRRAHQAEQTRIAEASSVARAVGPLPAPPRSGIDETGPAVLLSPSLILPRSSLGERDAETVMSHSPASSRATTTDDTDDAAPELPSRAGARRAWIAVGLAFVVCCALGLLGWSLLRSPPDERRDHTTKPAVAADAPADLVSPSPLPVPPPPSTETAPVETPTLPNVPIQAERTPPEPEHHAAPRSSSSHAASASQPAPSPSASAPPNRVKTVLDITE